MISTHILDTSLGLTASDVIVELAKYNNGEWQSLATEKTNRDGRIVFNCHIELGEYRLIFKIAEYFQKNNQYTFFTEVPVMFKIADTTRKYHIPLLLNPYGYSTYRGS